MKVLSKFDVFGRDIKLGFDGDDTFRTKCGAVSTSLLLITLVFMVIREMVYIYIGKITNVQTLLGPLNKARLLSEGWDQSIVLGYAMKTPELVQDYITVQAVFYKKGVKKTVPFFDCTERIYQELGDRLSPGMTARCFLMDSNLLLSGSRPKIFFTKCIREARKSNPFFYEASTGATGCKKWVDDLKIEDRKKPSKKLKKLLNEFT